MMLNNIETAKTTPQINAAIETNMNAGIVNEIMLLIVSIILTYYK